MAVQTKQWSRRRSVVAGTIGNALEWYDFGVYGFFAPIIASQFFPSDNPTVSLIGAFGAFAAGFLMRPVGAALFGHVGDRIGRGRALVLSVMMMAIPTFLIGFLPTYAHIGIAATILMVLLRMAQGLAVGGEYTASIVYLAEQAPPGRRGFFTSWAMFGGNVGMLLASAVGAGLSTLLSDAQLADWGWRIAFIGGIAVSTVAYFIRRGMSEVESSPVRESPLKITLTQYWRDILRCLGLNLGFAISFYLMFVYMITWLVEIVQEPRSTALDINTVSIAVFAALVPLTAMISDRIGRRKMLLFGYASMAALIYPLIWLMHHQDTMLILAGQLGFAVVLAISVSSIPSALTEMFPRQIRVTAVSIGYNLSFAIFGGTAPIVGVWLVTRSHSDTAFAWYIAAGAVISFLVALTVRDRHNLPLPD